ncbi:MAG TPA: hypothetical protein VIL20_04225 [Sandaracinaceae bacterium]
MRALFLGALVLAAPALAACGGATADGAGELAVAPSTARSASPEEHLFGLTEEALPELAPIWPALSARAATEVSETLRIEGERATHCVHVVVAGDFAIEAHREWRRGAEGAGFACEELEGGFRCADGGVALRVWADGGPDQGAPALEALAAEMGVDEEPSSTAVACVEGLGRARLATIDERLHRAALLEPWQPLHERLGAWRFLELRWSRRAEGDELCVRYRGDDEALELASEWARENGLAEADGAFQRVGRPLSFALELRPADEDAPEIELVLTREP